MAEKKRKIKRWKSRRKVSQRAKPESTAAFYYNKTQSETNTNLSSASDLNRKYEAYRQNYHSAYSESVAQRRTDGASVVKNQEARDRTRARHLKKKRKNTALMLFLLITLSVIAAAVCIFIFFKIDKIEVNGAEKYNKDSVIIASEIELGDSLFMFSESKVSERIVKELPYIGEVQFEHRLPGTLVISVTEIKAKLAFSENGEYILADSTGRIIDKTKKKPDSAALVRGAELSKKSMGEKLEYKNKASGELVEQILQALSDNKIEKITEIDVRNKISCRAIYDGRIVLEFGQITDLNYKVQIAVQSIENLNLTEPQAKGTLNLKQAPQTKEAYFRSEQG